MANRKVVLGGAIALVVVAAAAAYFLALGPAEQAEPIKIGIVAPLSSPGAYIQGEELRQGALLAVEEFNERGGLLGRKIVTFVEDSQGLPEKGRAVMEKLITKDQVVGVVGEYHSSVCLAEVEVVNRYKIPFVIATCWSDEIRKKEYEPVFFVGPFNSGNAEHIIKFLSSAGFKDVVALVEDTDFGIGLAKRLEAAIKRLNAPINFKSETVERTAKDFAPVLLKYKTDPPEVLVTAVTPPGGLLLWKQAFEIGLAPSKETMIYDATGTFQRYTEVWPAVGRAAVYMMGFAPFAPQMKLTDVGKSVVERFREKFGRDPTYVVMQGYDAMLAMLKAIEKAGSTEADKIIEALKGLRFMATRGEIYFSMEGGIYFHQWKDIPVLTLQYTEFNQKISDATILFPPEYATGKLIKPS